jgi:integrase
MTEQLIHTKVEPPTIRRNRRGLRGQKPPLKVKEIWAIRIRLQLEERIRDLAMFNLAIDSKLRACDLTALKVDDVAMSGRVKSRAIVIQKKTGRPVQFEITEQTRDTVARWIDTAGLRHGGFLFPSHFLCRAPDSYSPVCQTGLTLDRVARFGPCEVRHPFAAAREADINLSSDREPAGGTAAAWPHQVGKHSALSWNRGRRCSDDCRTDRSLSGGPVQVAGC